MIRGSLRLRFLLAGAAALAKTVATARMLSRLSAA